MRRIREIYSLGWLVGMLSLVPLPARAGNTHVAAQGDRILLNDRAVKIIGLRCSNALISEESTADLIAALDCYRFYGVNTVSVYLMGSRFGDVKGYLPDGSLNPIYRDPLARIRSIPPGSRNFQYGDMSLQ